MRGASTARRSLCAAALALALAAPVAATLPATAAAARTPSTPAQSTDRLTGETDREAAQRLFYDRLLPLTRVPVGWTGSVKGCRAGTISPAARAAMLDAVNLFRGMSGLQPVTTDPAYDDFAQHAALIMKAQDALSHGPTPDWACYTEAGRTGAMRSNLYLGVTGAHAIWGYMIDPGSGNTAAGHRRWILDPNGDRIGIGATDGSHALYVVPDRWRDGPTQAPEWMPWPVAGASSVAVEPGGRWSLSASDRATSFDAATVTVAGPAGPLRITRHAPQNGFGPNTLVWQVDGLPEAGAMKTDTTYAVEVSGVTRNGATLPPVQYSVTLVALRAVEASRPPSLTGTPKPGGRLSVDEGSWPTGTDVTVTWLRNGKPLTIWSDDYEVAPSDVGAAISAKVTASLEHHRDAVVTTPALTIQSALKSLSLRRSPLIKGTARVGGKLTATPGTWSPTPTRIAYAWYRGITRIKGATKPTYTVIKADRGQRLTVRVTAGRAGWAAKTAASAAVRVR